jgi:hypothetical protein
MLAEGFAFQVAFGGEFPRAVLIALRPPGCEQFERMAIQCHMETSFS